MVGPSFTESKEKGCVEWGTSGRFYETVEPSFRLGSRIWHSQCTAYRALDWTHRASVRALHRNRSFAQVYFCDSAFRVLGKIGLCVES